MLRTAGMAAVVLACTALGYGQSLALYRRVGSLMELERLILMLKGEIAYAGTPLGEAFREMAKRCGPPFRKFLLACAAEMEKRSGKTLHVILEEQARELTRDTGLLKGDVERFLSMGGRLGYLDVQMQLQTIQLYQAELEKERLEAQEDYRSKAKVYRSLGLSAGIFITLLLL